MSICETLTGSFCTKDEAVDHVRKTCLEYGFAVAIVRSDNKKGKVEMGCDMEVSIEMHLGLPKIREREKRHQEKQAACLN